MEKERQHERSGHHLVAEYERAVGREIAALASGERDRLAEIGDLATMLKVEPKHLSRVVKRASGKTPCTIYEEHLMDLARRFLMDPSQTAAEVARRLTMDPSNFNKFFKRFQGCTPGAYRDQHGVIRTAKGSPRS